jgi:hypothetical protein
MATSVLSDYEFRGDVDLTADSVLLLSGTAGTAGQVPKSQGAGLPPIWGDAGSGVDPVIAGMIF